MKRRTLTYTVQDGIAYVDLGKDQVALIDAADIPLLGEKCWYALKTNPNAKTFYATRLSTPEERAKGWPHRIYLHRLISGHVLSGDRVHVDHRDGNGLDCRRLNIREATVQQNGCNRSKYTRRDGRAPSSAFKGVHTGAYRGKPWRAQICVNGKRQHIGCFDSEVEAAQAYDAMARQLHGEFARTNFPAA